MDQGLGIEISVVCVSENTPQMWRRERSANRQQLRASNLANKLTSYTLLTAADNNWRRLSADTVERRARNDVVLVGIIASPRAWPVHVMVGRMHKWTRGIGFDLRPGARKDADAV
jgi:hypothetical protein